ncbi:potassium-transporting ATPase subunit KdpC [Athalassotoga saccharophila]|uniref:potassium-transporting ATPase subunit KdpC n=1 Tax=Athalassotoga saccharophila TaxID=1441386 RepID=UPI0018D7142F|nr:potassium-transporting ATPase subunit KdpC [Athalassotoga saccharophila]BBJ28479.1 potassium-transporting ATPase KdpC subunit [Athalassotoga saccharophila]
MIKQLKASILIFVILFVIVGFLYPLLITVIGNVFFPWQANGSIIYKGNEPIGSELIGQPFSNPGLFWSRPSSTAEFPYNALDSGGSNLGPTNKMLIDRVENRIKILRNSGITGSIPSELVLGSGSNLDPDINLESALVQIPRISKVTHIPENVLRNLVFEHLNGRTFGFMGARVINVLELNLALMNLEKVYGR